MKNNDTEIICPECNAVYRQEEAKAIISSMTDDDYACIVRCGNCFKKFECYNKTFKTFKI